ncbi:DUF192 domain-containing protein [uncultured Paraglaciecola sp.]|uniref:DUF192 domain-containing protein n=1 Tax=uncultured Paraglaciecola sp. TaxID=1765024 RepID=UPI002638CE87|nr:DUF192 domain-containing protein [uncultured Paraglaciecola sp.]
MPKYPIVAVFFVFSLLSSLAVANQTEVVFPQTAVQVKNNTYTLEYAHTFEQRAQGLMHRESMCENCGMLFNFQQARMASMWMKNTLIPLDIAFIRADGIITDIKAMQPHDLSTTNASQPVYYAWEMNQGWFAKNGIQVGDTVTISAK